jgi:hypothetical protein
MIKYHCLRLVEKFKWSKVDKRNSNTAQIAGELTESLAIVGVRKRYLYLFISQKFWNDAVLYFNYYGMPGSTYKGRLIRLFPLDQGVFYNLVDIRYMLTMI